jgi:hypothetical protein
MFCACKTVSLVAFVALLSAGPAFTQTPSDEATPEAKTAAPVAYVYVQTSKGVNAYGAAANGKLTLVKGSPFKTTGAIGASNGSHFITVGTDVLHSYTVESDGAIGEQVSTVNTQSYAGSECGNNTGSGAVLDHTGRDLYLMLYAGQECEAQQTFNVAKGTGTLEFGGAATANIPALACCTLLTLTGNNKFAYSAVWTGPTYCDPGCGNTVGYLMGFSRASDGTLTNLSFTETDPTIQPGSGWEAYNPPVAVAADTSNHLAAVIFGPPSGTTLASYTVDDAGNITSTNTWEEMPALTYQFPGGNGCLGCDRQSILSMSPSGKLLAAAIQPVGENVAPYGFQVFHFNGAAPITPFSSDLLPKFWVWQMAWDNSDHLYVLGEDFGGISGLYVYTVTPTTIAEAPGSPYKIPWLGNSNSLLVAAK